MKHKSLQIIVGQHSSGGVKDLNQDFYGIVVPDEPQRSSKGIAIAIADGISSSHVSQIASETAVKGFLHDYYCTSEAWSVKKSAQRVLEATNAWLYAQTRNSPFRYNKDKGYICAFSAMILKSNTAHVFHSGDARIYRLLGSEMEQITRDHRHIVSAETSYLTRGLGIHPYLEMDYQRLDLQEADTFVLATDGAYEYLTAEHIISTLQHSGSDLDLAAQRLIDKAIDSGSRDNLTLQIVQICSLPDRSLNELQRELQHLSVATALAPRQHIDEFEILRELYISSRSHVFLALDRERKQKVVIKTPSTEMRDDPEYLENLLMEDWIAQRINNANVLKAIPASPGRQYVYSVTEYIEGQTLAQWMIDNPRPSVEAVRNIVEQIANGLQAFHRQEIVHQDLRPNNIMIDSSGIVKIIDFGSSKVAGISEISPRNHGIQGTTQYTAPECYLGHSGSSRSDLFSLGVITYQMLSGKLPYGNAISRSLTVHSQRRLKYRPLSIAEDNVPEWLDFALSKATHINPAKRYAEVSEFIFDLKQPGRNFVSRSRAPLLDRDPVLFWQCVSLLLLGVILFQALD